MPCMRKFIISIIFLAVIGTCLTSFIHQRLPIIVSHFLTNKTKIPFSLNSISFHKECVQIQNISITNPKQSSFKKALNVRDIEIRSPYRHYFFNDPMVLDEILLNHVYVSLEISKDQSTACNWMILTEHFGEDSDHWWSNKRKSFIKKLILQDVVIDIKLFGKAPQRLTPIERIEFDNIDVDNGIPTQEISRIIVSKMMGSIFSLASIKELINISLNPFQVFIRPHKDLDPCKDYYH